MQPRSGVSVRAVHLPFAVVILAIAASSPGCEPEDNCEGICGPCGMESCGEMIALYRQMWGDVVVSPCPAWAREHSCPTGTCKVCKSRGAGGPVWDMEWTELSCQTLDCERHGMTVGFHNDNGQKAEELNFCSGDRCGIRRTWYPDGQAWHIMPFCNDKKCGHATSFNPDGTVMTESDHGSCKCDCDCY